MRGTCNCKIIGLFAHSTINGCQLAILAMTYLFGDLTGVKFVHAIGCQYDSFLARLTMDGARIGLGRLASIRSKKCTRKIGGGIGQDAIVGRQRVLLEGCS